MLNPKGNQSWIFIGKNDDEAPILWPPDAKSWLIRKDPDAGKDWRQVEKGMTEDKIIGWHHWLNGHEFEQAPGDGEGQGSLACCSPWSCKESDMTERLNNNNKYCRVWRGRFPNWFELGEAFSNICPRICLFRDQSSLHETKTFFPPRNFDPHSKLRSSFL